MILKISNRIIHLTNYFSSFFCRQKVTAVDPLVGVDLVGGRKLNKPINHHFKSFNKRFIIVN